MTTATIEPIPTPASPRRSGTAPRTLQLMQDEYVEMPGLALTLAQAARLWAIEEREAAKLLARLVESGFLVRGPRDSYRRRGTPRCC